MKLEPISYKVLIKDEIIENKTAGGIILDSSMTKRKQVGAVFGEIVDMGSAAFEPRKVEWINGKAHSVEDDFNGDCPKIGQRVLFIRNAGSRYIKDSKGFKPVDEDYNAEGEEPYRILNDIDIVAIAEKAND